MMDMDVYYIKIFLSPLLGFSIAMLVMKCCCKRRCFSHSSASEPQRRNTPVYVIPIPGNEDCLDEGSLSSVAVFAPPAYDSVVPAGPPPPYSQQKGSSPDEELPAYGEIIEEPWFACTRPPQTQCT